MATSRAVLLVRRVLPADLAQFVISAGGQWQDWNENPDFRQGVFVEEGVWLFIRGVDTQAEDLRFFSDEELRDASLECGASIVSVLTVDHTKGIRGDALASELISKILDHWGGLGYER